MAYPINDEVKRQCNCQHCLDKIQEKWLKPNGLARIDRGRGFFVARIRSTAHSAVINEWPGQNGNIRHIAIPFLEECPGQLVQARYIITEGLSCDPAFFAFFHAWICPWVNPHEAGPRPDRSTARSSTR